MFNFIRYDICATLFQPAIYQEAYDIPEQDGFDAYLVYLLGARDA